MSNRFALELNESERVLDHLQALLGSSLENADRLWIEALSTVIKSDLKSLTAADVHTILLTAVTGRGIPWNFYDIVSELIKLLPTLIRETLTRDINIHTGIEYEWLRITPDGHWQIVWEINREAVVVDYREIALDWYIPPEKGKAPIVPLPIIDHLASCVILLRKKRVLPAASVLSVVLEAALWDELQAKSLLQKRKEVTYSTVKWHFEKWYDQFRLKIEGADKNIADLIIPPELITGNSTREIIFNLRKTHVENSDKTVDLRLSVDKSLVSFLASDREAESNEVEPGRSLSTAIERARKANLECLRRIPLIYDQTLISLRNSLIHLPSNGILSEPIPIPGGGKICTADELGEMEEFIYQLLYLVSQVVRLIYKG